MARERSGARCALARAVCAFCIRFNARLVGTHSPSPAMSRGSPNFIAPKPMSPINVPSQRIPPPTKHIDSNSPPTNVPIRPKIKVRSPITNTHGFVSHERSGSRSTPATATVLHEAALMIRIRRPLARAAAFISPAAL